MEATYLGRNGPDDARTKQRFNTGNISHLDTTRPSVLTVMKLLQGAGEGTIFSRP